MSTELRDVCPTLLFYYKSKQAIQFRTLGNILIKGKIVKYVPQPLFSIPYLIIESEEGFRTKIIITEIKKGSIFNYEMKIDNNLLRKGVPASLKKELWRNHFGNRFKGVCFCCRSATIYRDNFHAGHVIAVANGGEDLIENLRPICQTCNSSMGTMNLNDFKNTYHS